MTVKVAVVNFVSGISFAIAWNWSFLKPPKLTVVKGMVEVNAMDRHGIAVMDLKCEVHVALNINWPYDFLVSVGVKVGSAM